MPFLTLPTEVASPRVKVERERKPMNRVVKILMKRDGLTKEEALELIEECREEIEMGNDYALEDVLGLEDDYLLDILF